MRNIKNCEQYSRNSRLINKVEDYIELHKNEKIVLKDIVDYIGMSAYHFHRIFKMCTSETLNEYILRFKLERSSVYLKINIKISITELAYAYGFSESSAYTRAFKKHFGISPVMFRKQQDMSS